MGSHEGSSLGADDLGLGGRFSLDPGFGKIDERLQELQTKPVDFKYYLRSLHKIQRNDILPYKFGMNQMHGNEEGRGEIDALLNGILGRFKTPVKYAFGYGSKIFSQGSNVDISNSQIDIICAVDDPVAWHGKNMRENGSDYSFLKHLGANCIDYVGNAGAGVYFNPFVNVRVKGTPLELKYGITSVDNLIDDLSNWTTMYLSGRLHKPVAIIENNPQLMFLNQYNLANAVKLAVLLLGKTEIKESELYLTIAGLSYMGDPRLKVKGENPDKVKNIVDNQFKLFKNLYAPISNCYFPTLIQKLGSAGTDNDQGYKVNMSAEEVAKILLELPRNFRRLMFREYINRNGLETRLDGDQIVYSLMGKIEKRADVPDISYNDLKSTSYSDSRNILRDIPTTEWEYLPADVKLAYSPIAKEMGVKYTSGKQGEDEIREVLIHTVEKTVGSSALVQSVKGILTAGLVRSWKYASAKRAKYKQSQAKKNTNI